MKTNNPVAGSGLLNPSHTIKIAELEDLDSLFELNKLFDCETTKEKIEELIKTNDREIICIAYHDDFAIGFCSGLIVKSICYNTGRLDIESLFVRDGYRRKNVGMSLLKFMEQEAVKRNLLHFHILTNKKNYAAIKLYEKLGYKNTGEILLDKTIE